MIYNISASSGWIEVVCGSMFSGKTQELIRRLKLATIAKQKVQVFNSHLDTRYGNDQIMSHDKLMIPSKPVKTAKEILKYVQDDTRVVGIDEAHFFGDDLLEVCQKLANSGKRVIVAGLDQDYRGDPFMNIAKLMAVAEFVTKNHAICMVCGNPAHYSQRLTNSDKRIEVGASDKYEARCRKCFKPEIEAGHKADGKRQKVGIQQ